MRQWRSAGSILVAVFSVCLFSIVPSGRCSGTPREVERTFQEALRFQQEVQEQGDRWAEERQALLEEIRDLKNQKRWLDFQRKKYREYIKREKASIGELNRREQELSRMNAALEPYLDEACQRLESFVNADLPFLEKERRRRLAFLQDTLDDYHLGLGEKLRRFFEALLVEARYGKEMGREYLSLELGGETREVVAVRLGRLAMFCQTPDGEITCRYDRGRRRWEVIPARYSREVELAIEVAERRRATDLLSLPVGRPWKGPFGTVKEGKKGAGDGHIQ